MTTHRRFERAGISALLAIGSLLFFGRCFFISGITSPIRVTGGSMAETLPGERFSQRCEHCDHLHSYDANVSPPSRAICPGCNREIEFPTAPDIELGERVLIDRGAYVLHSPQRHDVVAFRDHEGSMSVKRIAALPGDTWEIRRGDLWINGAIHRKSYEQAAAQAVFIAERRGDDPASSPSVIELQPKAATFHPAGVLPFKTDAKPAVLRDLDRYNPSLSRTLFPVSDCWVKIHAASRLASRIALTHENGSTHAIAELDFATNTGSFKIHGEKLKHDERFTLAGMRSARSIVWGRCDARYFLTINGVPLISQTIEPEAISLSGSTQPLTIASSDPLPPLSIRIERDLHLLAPHGVSDSWHPADALGEHEYALLGDNGPISIDSRQLGPIKREAIVGRVIRLRQSESSQ